MEIFYRIKEIRDYVSDQKKMGKSIGFVPTMGALHAGHLRLVESSVKDCDATICSIFVNPTQFNNPQDLRNYPRDEESDIQLLTATGCDAVFAPDVLEIYPQPAYLNMNFGKLETTMEGLHRPGHFNGVGIIVAKLFNIVQPSKAYFGKKDFQQLAIIKSMVYDLNFDLEIVSVETVRESGGLALSSRNRLLSNTDRMLAMNLYKSLNLARENLIAGQSPAEVKENTISYLSKITGITLEYFEIVDSSTLQQIDSINGVSGVSLCIAAHVGKARLIDNISLK